MLPDDSSGLDVPYSASGCLACYRDVSLACCSVVFLFSPSTSSKLVNYVDGPGLLGVHVVRDAIKITKFSPNLLGNCESNQEALSVKD